MRNVVMKGSRFKNVPEQPKAGRLDAILEILDFWKPGAQPRVPTASLPRSALPSLCTHFSRCCRAPREGHKELCTGRHSHYIMNQACQGHSVMRIKMSMRLRFRPQGPVIGAQESPQSSSPRLALTPYGMRDIISRLTWQTSSDDHTTQQAYFVFCQSAVKHVGQMKIKQ